MAGKRIINLFLLLSAACNRSDGELIIVPRDTVSKINQTVYFNCSTTLKSEDMFWFYGDKLVFSENEILEPFDTRFKIETDAKSCNLIIDSVQPGDAGEYSCTEERFEDKSSAQLVVIGEYPICQSNRKSDGIIAPKNSNNIMNPDEVELSCSVTFHGNRPPAMEWMKVGDDKAITDNVSSASSSSTYNITLKLKDDLFMDYSYVCQIAEAFPSHYNCNFDNFLYFDSMPTEENMGTKQKLSFIVINSVPCTYLLYNGCESLCEFACDETLTNPSKGEYQCMANCTIRRTESTFDGMTNFVAEKTRQSSPQGALFILGMIAGFLFFIMAASTLITVYVRNFRQKERRIDYFKTVIKKDLMLQNISEQVMNDLITKWNEDLSRQPLTWKKDKTEEII